MFLDGLKHSSQDIYVLLCGICTQMEPGIPFNGNISRCLPQGQQLLPAIFLQHLFLIVQGIEHKPQFTWLIVNETIYHLIVQLKGKTSDVTLCATDMVAEQIPENFGILGAHHQPETVILFSIGLPAIFAWAN